MLHYSPAAVDSELENEEELTGLECGHSQLKATSFFV